MITFLYGTDAYRIKQRVSESAAKGKWERFDVSSKEELTRFDQSIKTVGLFVEQTNYVLTDAFEARQLLELLTNYKLELDKDRNVIISAQGTKTELQKKNKELFAYLNSKKNTVEMITPLDDAELAKWTVKTARQYSLALSLPVARTLVQRITNTDKMNAKANNDRAFRLTGELQKLAHFKARSRNKEVTEQDLEALVRPVTNNNIFAITDAVANKNRGQATKLMYQSLHDGLDPYYLQSMLVYQFRNLITIKSMMDSRIPSSSIASKSKLHPFVVRKTSQAASKYSLDELKDKFTALQQLEIDTKSGTADLTDGLYKFVFDLV